MQATRGVDVLFIAGFGPIVRDTIQSRKLYSDTLGISFKEESGEYLHTEERTVGTNRQSFHFTRRIAGRHHLHAGDATRAVVPIATVPGTPSDE